MSLPANFSGMPSEELHRDFRNICIELKKVIHSSKDVERLQVEMDRFIDASKHMDWHHKTSGVYHKQEGDKAVGKVWAEFKRYKESLSSNPYQTNPQDLLNAFAEVERLVDSLKVR
ncbi:MAG: hypothetical protein ACM3JI_00500 [Anaerolineae bacterium]